MAFCLHWEEKVTAVQLVVRGCLGPIPRPCVSFEVTLTRQLEGQPKAAVLLWVDYWFLDSYATVQGILSITAVNRLPVPDTGCEFRELNSA